MANLAKQTHVLDRLEELERELIRIQIKIATIKPQLGVLTSKVNSSLNAQIRLYRQYIALDLDIELLVQQKDILERDFTTRENGLKEADQS